MLEPVYDPQAGEVTTGACLVLHALSRSYLGFTQPRFHDFVSSVLAREDLIANRIYSAVFAGYVATLIEFQNAVRTALLSKEEGEVGVWTGAEFKLGLDIIAPVLVREILKQWQQSATTTSDIVLQAHLAVALSYENRWTQSVASASSPRLKEQIKNSASFLAVSQETAAAAEGTLCIFEFASYAVGKGGLEKFAQAALSRIASGLDDVPRAWLSFGPFWSNNEAANLRLWLAEKGDMVNFAVDKYAGLANLRLQPKEQLPTYFGYLDLKPADRFEIVFGKQLSKAATSPTAWDLLEAAFQWFTEHRHLGGQAPALPVAAVGSILKMLEVMYPEQFCCVRLNQTHPQLPEVQLKSRLIVLPVVCPTSAELEELVHSADWLNPKLVVARYAAAELLNQRIAFGSGPLRLEFQSSASAHPSTAVAAGWLRAIDWMEKRNHHLTLLYYTEQAASPREDTASDLLREEGFTLPSLDDHSLALCIDIGGTGIKGGLYPIAEVDRGFQIAALPLVRFAFPTEPEKDFGEITGDGRYSGGQQFAMRLHDRLVEACNKSIEQGAVTAAQVYKPIALIGFTWPGAVAGERGREFVSATSKILSRFAGLTDEIVRNSPVQIHALRIREAINDTFRTSKQFGWQEPSQQAPLVTLLNDGAAHTLASMEQFDLEDLPPGCAIVLTAGTGTALGVLRDAEPLPILAEAGKFVIDLSAPFTQRSSFPVGTGNKMFSANTFVELAEQVITAYEAERLRQSLSAIPSAAKMLPILAIELGYYCAKLLEKQGDQTEAEKCAREWYESYAEAQLRNPILPPEEGRQTYQDVMNERQKQLRNALRFYGNPVGSPNYAALEKVIIPVLGEINATSPGLDGLFTFTLEVAFRSGCLLADVIATADGLFGVSAVLATGGPMSGAMGKLVRAFARHELKEGYGYNVVEQFTQRRDRQRSLRLHGIYFPEPQRELEPHREMATSAAWGAGKAALELYRQRLNRNALLQLEEWLRACQPGASIRLNRDVAAGVTRIACEGRPSIDIEADIVSAYLHEHKARLGLCAVPDVADEFVDEFVKVDDVDIHVM